MVRTIIEDKTAIINIEKNIISENVDILEDKLNYAKNAGALNFIFDFHNIEYMCSSALGLIASALRVSAENGGTVYFCSMTSQLKKLFEATKFLTIVNISDNVDDALNNISN
ncbi:STAS domain-containing protein [Brachyspira alvinipulli]|uniref:STAS domain-containing protein n=1 Tax=Brachyspira alvinipulli TaxID=84379 RepID=UPI003005DE75